VFREVDEHFILDLNIRQHSLEVVLKRGTPLSVTLQACGFHGIQTKFCLSLFHYFGAVAIVAHPFFSMGINRLVRKGV
jgi:hypothetical protein